MNSYYACSSVCARLFILPWISKKISASSWILKSLRSLSISLWVPNVPYWENLSKVDNIGRIVPATTSQLRCPKRKSGYRWSNVISTRLSPDYLNPNHMTFFPLSRNEDLDVYSMFYNAHRYSATISQGRMMWPFLVYSLCDSFSLLPGFTCSLKFFLIPFSTCGLQLGRVLIWSPILVSPCYVIS